MFAQVLEGERKRVPTATVGNALWAPLPCLLRLMEGLPFQQPLHWVTRQTAPLDPWQEGPLFGTSFKAHALASHPLAVASKIQDSYPEAKEKPSPWKTSSL